MAGRHVGGIRAQPIADQQHCSVCDAVSAPSGKYGIGDVDFAGRQALQPHFRFDVPHECVGIHVPNAEMAARATRSPLFAVRVDPVRQPLHRPGAAGQPPDLVIVLTGEVLRSVLSAQAPQNDDAVAQDREVVINAGSRQTACCVVPAHAVTVSILCATLGSSAVQQLRAGHANKEPQVGGPVCARQESNLRPSA
jgi:hypothetical protein